MITIDNTNSKISGSKKLKAAIGQIEPVWLNRAGTITKIIDMIDKAAEHECDLIVFGEGLLPGYPFWLTKTNAAEFNSNIQKDIFAHYLDQSVNIAEGDIDEVCDSARSNNIAVYLGCIEKADDRGGHSLYCSLVYISKVGTIESVHRKLVPTYEERLVWSNGDGNGLQVHDLDGFKVGGLNCWENWMPMARTALYAQGENVHIAVWPGYLGNTEDITQFIAKESRSFVISASSILRKQNIPSDMPYADLIAKNSDDLIADGGSCIAGPDGEWIVKPVVGKEALIFAELDHSFIRRERQNFDPSGHYSRPDVLQLHLNTERQAVLKKN